jgi:hypothetical protein
MTWHDSIKKRERSASGVAETQVVTEDEGDEEGANGSSGGDSQGGDRQNRVGAKMDKTGIDRNETEGNSRPISSGDSG